MARFARALLAGDVEYDQFATAACECEQDDDIDELENLITHMPQCGGFGGVSEDQHKRYLEIVLTLIRKLEE